MTTPYFGAPAAVRENELATICLVLLSVAFPLGLLACSGALPLHWLAAQEAAVIACLVGLAVTSVSTTMRLAGMGILAGRTFRRNVLIAQLAASSLLCLAFPAVESRARGIGGDVSSWDYRWSAFLALVLCGVTVSHAASRTRAWTLLEVQPWEADDGKRSRAGGASRSELLGQTWLSLGGVTLVLALALLLHGRAAPNRVLEGTLGLAAFGTYLVVALVLACYSAHRRKMAQWQLAGCDVPARVTGEWRRAGSDSVLLTLIVAALLLASHLLDIVRVLAAWLGDAVLLPLLRLLPWGWFSAPAPTPCPTGACAHSGGPGLPTPARHVPMLPSQSEAGIWRLLDYLWRAFTHAVQEVAGQWPVLLGVVAVLALAYASLSGGQGRSGRRGWRSLVATLSRYVRLLAALLPAPARRLAARARVFAARGPDRVSARIRRMHGPALDGLPARKAVVTLYLAALEHAARRGYARRAGQTPAEYAADLGSRVPEAHDAASGLTQAFVAARYGPGRVDSTQVERARDAWQRLRSALRRRHGRTGSSS